MSFHPGHRLMAAMLALSAAMPGLASGAETFPSKVVRIVVPGAGGAIELLARVLATYLREPLKQPVIVENKPGAGGNIGLDFLAKSEPDGHTLGIGFTPMTINVSLYQKLPYHPRDFAPITLAFTSPQFLVINPRIPVSNLSEFVAYAKANPTKVSYGSSGLGTASHLQMEMFKRAAGIELLHVAYKGAGPAMNDVIGGEVQAAAQLISNVLSNVRGGRLKALGVIGAKRSASAPDVPTFAEAGYPGYEFNMETWVGVMAPAGTPKPIIDRYNREIVGILKLPEVQAQFRAQELDIVANSSEEFSEFIRLQIERWGRMVQTVGLRLD